MRGLVEAALAGAGWHCGLAALVMAFVPPDSVLLAPAQLAEEFHAPRKPPHKRLAELLSQELSRPD